MVRNLTISSVRFTCVQTKCHMISAEKQIRDRAEWTLYRRNNVTKKTRPLPDKQKKIWAIYTLIVSLGDRVFVQRSKRGLHRPPQTDHRPPADQTLDRHELEPLTGNPQKALTTNQLLARSFRWFTRCFNAFVFSVKCLAQVHGNPRFTLDTTTEQRRRNL